MQYRRAGSFLVAASLLSSCNAIAVAPTSPTIVPPVVIVDSPPPVLPSPRPVELELSVTLRDSYAGEGLSLRAITMKGELFSPAVYTWAFGDGETETTDHGFAGHVYASSGEYPATVHVRDRDGSEADASAVIVVTRRPSPPRDPPPPAPCPRITLAPSTLPNGTVGTNYSRAIAATGGKAPYGFSVATGATLPAGLLLSDAGLLSGSPTTAGSTTFVVNGFDSNGCLGQRSYTVIVGDRPGVMTASLSCTATSTTANTVACNISGTYSGQPVGSSTITNVDWEWDDSTTSRTTSPAHTHLYPQPGTWTVLAVMTATTADGPRTATASRTVTVPRPTP